MSDSMHSNELQYEPMSEADFDHPPVGPVGVHRGRRSWVARFVPFISVVVLALVIGLLAWSILTGEINRLRFPWQQTATTQLQEVASPKQDSDKNTAKSNDSNNSDAQSSQSDNANDNASDNATSNSTSETNTQNNTSDSQSTASAAYAVNKATAVTVVNATRITGHAGQKATVLKNAGYTQVTATNPSGSVPANTVVWYQNETDKSTAEDVARILGITNIEARTDIKTPIVVVLLQ